LDKGDLLTPLPLMPPLSVLIKPASGLCNINCSYCFYRCEDHDRGIMSPSVAQTAVRRIFAVADGWVNIVFQGGEPTLAGLGFFRDFVRLCNSYNTRSVQVNYALQTNGLLLDDDFCEFLARNRFLVGLSFDGTPALHDSFRSHSDEVLASAERLKKHGVEFNVLTVVTSELARHGGEVYRFLRLRGFDYLQFIPCLPPEGVAFGESFSPSAEEYGAFLCEVFDLWISELKKGVHVSVRYFDSLLKAVSGAAAELCFMGESCINQTVIESDGSVYPCDFYVDPQHYIGNISDGIPRLYAKSSFFTQKSELPKECKECRFTYLCHSGCRREHDQSGKSGLCGGFRRFFEHAEPILKRYIANKK